LRPPLGELVPHALRAAPHLDHLDAALADVVNSQVAREPGLVQLREDTVDGAPRGRMAEAVRDQDAPVPIGTRVRLWVGLSKDHGRLDVALLLVDPEVDLKVRPIAGKLVHGLPETLCEGGHTHSLISTAMATRALPEIDAQYRELREGAGLVDRSERAALEVRGPDAGEFLQGQVTNDVLALEAGQGCYAAMLNPKGRVLADMRIACAEPGRFLIDTESAALDAVLGDLRMYKIGRQVEVADIPDRSIVSLIGPRSDEVVESGLGARLPGDEHALKQVAAGTFAVRTNLGIDALADGDQAAEIRERLLSAGAQPVSLDAAEILRIESGRPRHGLDMTEDNLPAEAGIVTRSVSFTKGCYVGQEPVARMHYKGHPNRHLRGLLLSEQAERGASLFSSDREVGRVTSTGLSPALGPVALALVRREVSPGDEVSVGPDGPTATVVELPFGIS
jgi:tRNA-modifying protein YgfZ